VGFIIEHQLIVYRQKFRQRAIRRKTKIAGKYVMAFIAD